MIGNKLEQSIIGAFQDHPSSTFSINELSKILKKSYPNINKKANFFLDEGVLKKIVIGNAYQCSLNMKNDKAKAFMVLHEINKKDSQTLKNKEFPFILDEVAQLSEKFPLEFAVFYKKSIFFVLDNKKHSHDILEQSILTKTHQFIFMTRKEFQDYFLEDEDFQSYHVVLLHPAAFVHAISALQDQFTTRAFTRQKKTQDTVMQNSTSSTARQG